MCGKEVKVAHNRLISKKPKTHCGCKNPLRTLAATHVKEYHAWWDAKNRCHNPAHPSFPSYGAKGIRMCEAWQKDFAVFLNDVGPRPRGMSLDRIDPHGPYSPSNVRWACNKTQARNKKGTKYVKHPNTGERVKAADLVEELGKPYQVVRKEMIEKGLWYDPATNKE